MEGRLLAERYRLLGLLGQGGMGSVWVAEHIELGTRVAVKLIDPSMASSEEALGRFKREAQAAATLRSTHVVQIFDYGVDGGTPFIAMELLHGESLSDRLERLGKLSPEVTSSVITQTARAVGKAHEIGVVHRDLKPDNIFIVCEEDQEVCKVLDFGIAKQTLDGLGQAGGPQTRTGALLGTPFYMSPEQATGKRKVDHRTDIWAMAVIAFECLVGRRPFDEQTLAGILLAICSEPAPVPSQCGQVPAGFDAWFACGVAKDPDHRFASARDAASALQQLCVPHAARQAFGSLPDLDTQGAAVVATGLGAGSHAAQAVTAPSHGGVAHAASSGTDAAGPSVGSATGIQMPPSAVTVPGVRSRSGAKLLLLGLAATAVVGVVAALLLTRGEEPDVAASAASSESAAAEPIDVEASIADPPRVEPSPVESAAATPSPSASDGSAQPDAGPPDPTAKQAAPASTKPRSTATAKPTRSPPRRAAPAATARPATRNARDRLDNGFGF